MKQGKRESYSLTDRAEEHELSSPEFFDSEYGNERSGEILSAIQRSEKTTGEPGETDTVLKDGGGVVLSIKSQQTQDYAHCLNLVC